MSVTLSRFGYTTCSNKQTKKKKKFKHFHTTRLYNCVQFYLSTVQVHGVQVSHFTYFHFMLLYTSTSLHFRDKCYTFHSNTFIPLRFIWWPFGGAQAVGAATLEMLWQWWHITPFLKSVNLLMYIAHLDLYWPDGSCRRTGHAWGEEDTGCTGEAAPTKSSDHHLNNIHHRLELNLQILKILVFYFSHSN